MSRTQSTKKDLTATSDIKQSQPSAGNVEFQTSSNELSSISQRYESLLNELRQKNDELNLLTSSISESVWITDLKFKPIYISMSSKINRGYSYAELMQMTIQDHLTKESFERLMQESIVFAKYLDQPGESGEHKLTIDLEFTKKDGSTIWREVTISLNYGPDGMPNGYQAVSREIEERRQMEMLIRKQETLNKEIMDSAPVGICVVNVDGNINYMNIAGCQIMGLEQDRVIGMFFNDPSWIMKDLSGQIIPQDNLPYYEVLQTRKPIISRKVITRRGDDEIIVSLNLSPLLSLEKEPTGVVVTFEDITEQISKQNELIFTQNKYQSLFSKMKNGFALHEIILDKSGNPVNYRWLEVNEAFEKMTGLIAENIIGKTVLEVLPETEEYWITTYGDVAKTGNPKNLENYSIELGKWFSVNSYSPAKNQFATIIEDITERKNAEIVGKLSQDISDLFTTSDSIDSIFGKISKLIVDTFRLPICIIETFDLDSEMVKILSTQGLSKDYYSELPFKDSLGGLIAKSRKQQLFRRPFPINNPRIHALDITQSKFLLGLPILTHKEVIGAIIVADTVERVDLDEISATLKIISLQLAQEISRYQAELELMSSEERYRAIYVKSTACMLTINPDDLLIKNANQAACDFYGYSRDEILTKKITDLSTDTEENIRKTIDHVINHTNTGNTFIHRLANDELRTVEIFSSPIVIGGKLHVHTIIHDLTEKHVMELELRKSEERNRRMIETANEGIWAVDYQGLTSFVNPRLCELLGFSSDEMIRRPITDFLFPEDVHGYKNLTKTMGKGRNGKYEQRFRRRDNSMIWFLVSETVIVDQNNHDNGSFAMFTDITERKLAEEKLKTNETLLLNTLNNSPIVVFALDLEGKFLVSEGKGLKKLGFAPGQVVGLSALDVYKNYPSLISDLRRAIRGDQFNSITELIETKYEIWYNPIFNDQNVLTGTIGIAVDITDRLNFERALVESEQKFKELFNTSHDGIAMTDEYGRISQCNQAFATMLGYKNTDELMDKSFDDLTAPEFHEHEHTIIRDLLEKEGYSGEFEKEYIRVDGSRVPVLVKIWLRKDRNNQSIGAWALVQDITTNREAKRALEISESRFRNLAMNAPVGIYENDANGNCIYVNRRWNELTGIKERVFSPGGWLEGIHPEDIQKIKDSWERIRIDSDVFYEEYRRILPDGKVIWISDYERRVVNNEGKLTGYLGTLTDITQIKNAENDVKQSLSLLRATLDSSKDGIVVIDLNHQVSSSNKQFFEIWNLGNLIPVLQTEKEVLQNISKFVREPEQFLNRVSEIYQNPDTITTDVLRLRDGRVIERFTMPQKLEGKIVGRVWSYSNITERTIADEKLRQNFEEMQLMVKQLTALRNIDIAITGHNTFFDIVKEIMPNVVTSLNVDAASLLMPHPDGKHLTMIAYEGLSSADPDSETLYHKLVPIKSKFAGSAYRDRRTIVQPVLDISDPAEQPDLRFKEKFSSYIAAPLIAKDSVKGVLEVFTRKPISVDKGWKEFLHSLTLQIAIAIDNADLFNQMQRTNLDLLAAYEATIEGWAKALELRDKETLGHSQRVIDLTLRLARDLGIPQNQWIQIRRGVFLHDIGKMGIPDNILLKPGPLTDDEWVIMKQHPTFAYEMLSGVPYLRPALDIPYCHHERWDGSGYPQGLDGDQIPLAARIFAVVDVWDALTSKRPYRPAWPVNQVKAYMKENANKQFDPVVVEAFLRIMEAE